MKRIKVLVVLAMAWAMTASAQLKGDGYYRVQSVDQGRYISVIDNRGSINMSTTSADMGALRTVFGFERVVSDPSSVIYIKKMGGGYDFQSQGTGSYAIISHAIQIYNLGDGSYWAYASAAGMTKYLMDGKISWMWGDDDPRRIYGELTAIGSPKNTEADWHIKPITTADDNYFGFTPDVAVGNSYYQSFYASFPFTFASAGMSAYVVTKIDPKKSAVIIGELPNGVPAATPVIIKCSSAKPINNKLNIGASASSSVNGNLLKGVYFCNDVNNPAHRNVVDYDAATKRVLGKAADGSLAFVKQADLKYIPANRAYITVDADAPDELKVYTQAEYDALFDPIIVQVTVNDATRKYGEVNPKLTYTVAPADVDLTGKITLLCDANVNSGVGEYAITAAATVGKDTIVTCVNGKLTITPTLLKVTANDATRYVGEENPKLTLTYAGFVNGETESVLTMLPQATTTATAESPEGTYEITVSGGVAENYEFEYKSGTLTILAVSGVGVVKQQNGQLGDVFDLKGRKVRSAATTLDRLPKGVYVIGGRKVVK